MLEVNELADSANALARDEMRRPRVDVLGEYKKQHDDHKEKRCFSTCMALCRPLAEATGDRIAAVDSILWLACNKGVLVVDSGAGPTGFPGPASLPAVCHIAQQP